MPRAWCGRGAVRVFTRWPPPSRGRSQSMNPSREGRSPAHPDGPPSVVMVDDLDTVIGSIDLAHLAAPDDGVATDGRGSRQNLTRRRLRRS